MKLSRPIIILILISIFTVGGSLWLFQNGYFSKPQMTFDPPYPEVNANGDPILAVFDGRVPCSLEKCVGGRLKVELVLYQNKQTKIPTTYWLGLIGSSGNDRIVTKGSWTTHQGVKGYPEAVVYELDSNTELDFRHYWKVNDNILFLLDENLNPKAGNAAWGYTLNRYDAPYGPKTYK